MSRLSKRMTWNPRAASAALLAQRGARLLRGEQLLELVEADAEQLLEAKRVAQALDVLLAVHAMATGRPLGAAGQQPDLLVVPDRARRGAGAPRDLADPQPLGDAHTRASDQAAAVASSWEGRSRHTTAPTSDVAARTHSAVCMLWMNGSSCAA